MIVIRRPECWLIDWRLCMRANVSAKRSDLTGDALDKLVKELEMSDAPFANHTAFMVNSFIAGFSLRINVNLHLCAAGLDSDSALRCRLRRYTAPDLLVIDEVSYGFASSHL